MPSQLSMWNDNDPERSAEDGGGLKRSRSARTKTTRAKKQRTSSAATRRARKTAKKATSPARPAKPKRARSSVKKPRSELPKNREYKTKRGARYVLSRVED